MPGKALSLTRPPNRSASVLFAVSRDIKSRKALDLDLDDRLDGCRVAVDEEFAEDIGSAQHNIEVVAREDVLDVPEDLVVVFLVSVNSEEPSMSRLRRPPGSEENEQEAGSGIRRRPRSRTYKGGATPVGW